MVDHLHEEVALHADSSLEQLYQTAGDLGISMQSAQYNEVTSRSMGTSEGTTSSVWQIWTSMRIRRTTWNLTLS